MTSSGPDCPEGRDPAQILAYVEGDLDQATSSELEAHLRTCDFCSSEYESLRKADQLLKVHSDAFHPDEEELYHFVSTGEDVDKRISLHLASCQDCSDDVDLLREMLQAGAQTPAHAPEMPHSLISQLEQLHTAPKTQGLLERLYASVTELMRLPFQMPVLALGTAAAVVVFVIVSIPLWRTFKPIAPPSVTAPQEQLRKERIEAPFLGGVPMKRAPAGSAEVRIEGRRGQEPPATPPTPASELPALDDSDKLDQRMPKPPQAAPFPPRKAKPSLGMPEQESSGYAGLPSAPPIIQERQEEKDQEVPRAVYVKRKYVKSEPAGKEEVSESTREEAPGPRRMVPPKPDHVKREKADKAESAVSPREEARRPTDQELGLADSRTPLSVRVTDSEGKTIPWLKFPLPQDLAGRYHLIPEVEAEKQARLGAGISKESASASFQNRPGGETRISIVVREHSGVFDLEAKLFESGSAQESKGIDAVGVAKEDLADSVVSLVASLLNAGQ